MKPKDAQQTAMVLEQASVALRYLREENAKLCAQLERKKDVEKNGADYCSICDDICVMEKIDQMHLKLD